MFILSHITGTGTNVEEMWGSMNGATVRIVRYVWAETRKEAIDRFTTENR